jgi:hypothetical protein
MSGSQYMLLLGKAAAGPVPAEPRCPEWLRNRPPAGTGPAAAAEREGLIWLPVTDPRGQAPWRRLVL